MKNRAIALLLAVAFVIGLIPAVLAAGQPVEISEKNFPDAAFRAYISETFDTVKDGVLSEEELAQALEIVVNGKGIADLTGVELFPNLLYLDCGDNQITSLNLSSNPILEVLYCYGNPLTALDVSNNTTLKRLNCAFTTLTQLNLTANPKLVSLVCSNNALTELDVGNNILLEKLDCTNNALTKLVVSANVALTELDCSGNALTELDVSNNPVLTYLGCSNNQLSELNVAGNYFLEFLYCDHNGLTELNVAGNPKLTDLECSYNALTALDVTGNPSLWYLVCSHNQLTSLDVSGFALIDLYCTDNAYNIALAEDRTFDLRGLPGGFDPAKASDWVGGTAADYVLHVEEGANVVTYSYAASATERVTFTLHILPEIVEPVKFEIVQEPVSYIGDVGDDTFFHVEATGEGLTYQWYYKKTNSKSWTASTLPGADTDTLQLKLSALRLGQQYQCVITDIHGDVLSSQIVTMNVKDVPFEIVTQPENYFGSLGDAAGFHVEVTGQGLRYQWYYTNNSGKSWSKSSMNGATTNTLTVVMTAKRVTQQYRCVITDASGRTLTSDIVTLCEAGASLQIVGQPADVSGRIGDTASFHVAATGVNVTYQWYFSNNSGKSWSKSSADGATTDTLRIAITARRIGQMYKCVVLDEAGNQAESAVVSIVGL